MFRDLRYALQLIAREPWYSAVAVLALSLGIGLNATVFTLVNAVLIRGLPFKDSDRLLVVGSQFKNNNGPGGLSLPDLADFRAQSKTFSALCGYDGNSMNISDEVAPPQQARGVRLTSNTFDVLGQPLLLGRDFVPEDDRVGAQPVTILGYALWKSRYDGDPKVLGRIIRIDGNPVTIVGVMPEGMMFPAQAELWTALVPTRDEQVRSARFLGVFGRLRPGATRAQALAEVDGIAVRLATAYPDTNKDYRSVIIQSFNEAFNGGKVRVVFLAMMGAVGFVLLIACANVANLQLARSVRRSREVAVRIALGASRWRIVRQLLVESVLLGCLGGIIGLGLAVVGVRLFDRAVTNVGKPYWIVFSFDPTVFTYLAAVCVLTGILFGLAPALQVSRTNVNEILKEGGRGNAGGRRARWMTGTMVVLELALTLVLLVGAGLMIRSFLNLYTIDLGIKTGNLMTMRMLLPVNKYPTPESRRAFYEHLSPRLAAIAGVESVSFGNNIPPFGAGRRGIEIEGRPPVKADDAPQSGVVIISPAFFDTLGVQLRRGRGFHDADGAPGSETIVINEKLAGQLFPNEDPIGRRIRFVQTPKERELHPTAPPPVWRTIVGISPTLRYAGAQSSDPLPIVFTPLRQEPNGFTMLLVRSRLEPGVVMAAVRREVALVDPDQPVFTVQTMADILHQQMWPYQVFGTLFAIFAGIALVMSAVGLYAVMAYSVTQRTSEIGVRMALGANSGQVSWLVLKRGLFQTTLGVSIGLVGAFFLSKVMSSLLVDITARDPITFATITAVLTSVSIAACLFPAQRATRVDPLVALRVE
jgi:putative ABC transport system permease protein